MGLEKRGRRGLVGEKWETEGKCRGGCQAESSARELVECKSFREEVAIEEGFEGRGVLLEGKGIKTSSGTGEGMYKGTVAHM